MFAARSTRANARAIASGSRRQSRLFHVTGARDGRWRGASDDTLKYRSRRSRGRRPRPLDLDSHKAPLFSRTRVPKSPLSRLRSPRWARVSRLSRCRLSDGHLLPRRGGRTMRDALPRARGCHPLFFPAAISARTAKRIPSRLVSHSAVNEIGSNSFHRKVSPARARESLREI